MVAERRSKDIVFEERLVKDGVTVAQALRENLDLPSTKGIGPWKKTVSFPTTFPPTPDYQFEECQIISSNNCSPRFQVEDEDRWVIARGRIGDHLFLVINDQIPLSGPWQSMDIAVDKDEGKLTHLTVITVDENGQKALHLVNPQGETNTYFEGAKTIEECGWFSSGTCWKTTDNLDHQSLHFIKEDGSAHTLLEQTKSFKVIHTQSDYGSMLAAVAGQDQEGITFIAWDMAKTPPVARKLFEVPDQLDPQKIIIYELSKDYEHLIWSMRRTEEEKGKGIPLPIFFNNRLITECDNVEIIKTNDDFQRILLAGRRGQETFVMLNGQIIYQGELLLFGYSWTSHNKQLTLISIALQDRTAKKKHLLMVTPDGHFLSEPVDNINIATSSDEAIEIPVEKDGKQFMWTIRTGQKSKEPQISEEQTAAA